MCDERVVCSDMGGVNRGGGIIGKGNQQDTSRL